MTGTSIEEELLRELGETLLEVSTILTNSRTKMIAIAEKSDDPVNMMCNAMAAYTFRVGAVLQLEVHLAEYATQMALSSTSLGNKEKPNASDA